MKGQWSSKLAEYAAAAQVNASRFDSSSITEDTRRQLKKVGSKSLDPDETSQLADILSRMGKIYGTHKVNSFKFNLKLKLRIFCAGLQR